MINSLSTNNLPIYNQNYNINIQTINPNFINSNINEKDNINSIYSNNIIHKTNSAFNLTTHNYPLQNKSISVSPSNKIPQNKPNYNLINQQNIYNKMPYINHNYQSQNDLSMKRHYSTQNINYLNLNNILNIPQEKNDLSSYDKKTNKVFNNITPINKNHKISKIPHPIFLKKKILEQNQIENKIIETKFNTNYINYNNNISPYPKNLNNYSGNISHNKIFNTINNDLTSNSILNNNIVNVQIEPDKNSKLSDFICIKKIGQGTEGIIFSVKWKRNNKDYAIKKCQVKSVEACHRRNNENILIKDFIEKTGCDGILKIYGSLCTKNDLGNLIFYEIMELAEKDWEKEILERKNNKLYYNEFKLIDILKNLVKALSLLQSRKITHRDIKPQNIMIINGKFKICDFGNVRILKKDGNIIQRIRGSELFMSPILFKGYRAKMPSVKHNTYKSDVFSLGMCIFFAASLTYESLGIIREIYDMNIIKKVLDKYLGQRYTQNFINIIYIMLQVEEKNRPDFNQLETLILSYYC